MSSQVSCVVNPALTILLQSAFDDLVRQIGFSWGILVTRVYSSPFLVGALFADPTYDVRGQSDTILKGLSGSPLLATEAKRATDFPVSKLWHHGSRGIQTLCPQILLGVRQYLTRRNASKYSLRKKTDTTYGGAFLHSPSHVLCHYASYYDMRAGWWRGRYDLFLDAGGCANYYFEEYPGIFDWRIYVREGVRSEEEEEDDASSKKQARSGSLRKIVPQYISGYRDDGQPIYTKIRVMNESQLEELEEILEE